jgi:hypothetical protein
MHSLWEKNIDFSRIIWNPYASEQPQLINLQQYKHQNQTMQVCIQQHKLMALCAPRPPWVS